MTTGGDGSKAETEADEISEPGKTALPAPPVDAAAWRAFFASLPPREIWRVLQKEKISHARIFAGFRPAPEMLRTHPVVASRLVDEAVKFPAFAKAVREIAAPPAAPLLPEGDTPAASTAPAPAPAVPKPLRAEKAGAAKNAEAAADVKEKLKEVRGVVRNQVARIKELEAAVAQAGRDREAAKAEAAQHLAARRMAEEQARRAEAETERQKRDRDRAARRAAAKEQAPAVVQNAAPPLPAAVSLPPADAPPVRERLLHDAAERLLMENREAQVGDLCREALRLVSEGAASASPGERGRVHALYASALYGLHVTASAEEQDRLAADAFLDSGDAVSAAEAVARRLALGNDPVRAADVPVLRRLTLLAQKLHQLETVQAVFLRLRITAPSAFRRLQEASGLVPLRAGVRPVSGGAAFADLLGASGDRSGGGAIGPDETVTLPLPASGNGTTTPIGGITPRQLVRAVDAGNSDLVGGVRAALALLRDQNKQTALFADALLEAVADLSPVAVCPLLHAKTRPVLVDASNVARYTPDPLAFETPPRVQNLRLMRDYLLRRGYFPVTLIADANLRYHVDDKPGYLEMLEKQIVREAPPGMVADEMLLWEAHENHAPLVTNDRLAEWGEAARRIERAGFLVSASGVSLTPF